MRVTEHSSMLLVDPELIDQGIEWMDKLASELEATIDLNQEPVLEPVKMMKTKMQNLTIKLQGLAGTRKKTPTMKMG